MRYFEMIKLTFKILGFKFEQRRLTTSIYSIVKTKLGNVRGVKRNTIWDDSYYSFERIPFAKPPLGELRFRAPEPAEPWERELDCTGPAEKPLQTHMLFRKHTGAEDCLYLNVFSRDLQPAEKRPVMVWIYGGGFQVGEATRDMYSPDFFMSKNVVLVTVAYRLGPIGFLSFDDPNLDIPGNAGLKDQILALRWVRANIEAFGGDPDNVTVFGESAGGASTHWITLSPQTEGLVHKAIIMSGSALCPWSQPPRNDWGFRLAKKVGFIGLNKDKDIYSFLKTIPGRELVKASATVLTKEEKHNRILFAFGPVVEPYVTAHCVMPDLPLDLMRSSWSNSIPILLGGTSFEGLLFYPEVTRRPATLDEVGNCKNMLPIDIGDNLDPKIRENLGLKLKETYFGNEEPCNLKNMMKFLDLESYREFWHPIYRTALSRMRYADAPTYLYRFDYDSKVGNAIRIILCGPEIRGACHGDDLCYMFHSMLSNEATPHTPEFKVTRAMIDVWTSFARTGNPNCISIEHIKFKPLTMKLEAEENAKEPVETIPLKCLNISEKISYIELPELSKLQIWNSLYPRNELY